MTKTILKLYVYLIFIFTITLIISEISMLWLNFIPYPIDKSLFWSSFAADLGFIIEFLIYKYNKII